MGLRKNHECHNYRCCGSGVGDETRQTYGGMARDETGLFSIGTVRWGQCWR